MWGNTSMTFGGGGFMDNSYSTNTQTVNKDEKTNSHRANNILPMMIGHINKYTGDLKMITDAPIKQVTVVGILKKLTKVTTKITYELEDETGTILAHKWLEADGLTTEQVQVNNYIRIYGHIREQGKELYLFVLNVQPVKKYAEIFCHMMEIIYMGMKIKNAGSIEPVEDDNNANEDEACHGLTNEQKIIYNIIKANATDDGIEKSQIKLKVPKNLISKIEEIIEFLVGEGHIYTARTDDHYKAT